MSHNTIGIIELGFFSMERKISLILKTKHFIEVSAK